MKEKYQVTGQKFVDRQGDRNRGLSEGSLRLLFLPAGEKVFDTLAEAESFAEAFLPRGTDKIREYVEITPI